MEQFLTITGRNIKIYLRDKGAVFFSMLSTIIVICLMLFFLGDMNIENITQVLAQFPGRTSENDVKNAELFILSWTGAGILSINAVTVTLASFSGMIKDRESGKMNSIFTAPVSRITIAAGYIGAAWVSSVIVCVITLVIIEAIGVVKGMEVYSTSTHLQLLGLIMVNSFVFAAFMYPLTMIAKTEGAWSGLGTVVGTLVGFLGGIYIPIGALSEGIVSVMKCTPIIYSTAMFRKVMNEEILSETFTGVPLEAVGAYREAMGIDLVLFERTLGVTEEWLILLLCGIILLGISALMLRYEKKADR